MFDGSSLFVASLQCLLAEEVHCAGVVVAVAERRDHRIAIPVEVVDVDKPDKVQMRTRCTGVTNISHELSQRDSLSVTHR